MIEGNLEPNDQVLMVEDVTTTGNSLLKAIRAVEEAGGKVVQLVSVVDRNEGAVDLFQKEGYPFVSLLTIDDII